MEIKDKIIETTVSIQDFKKHGYSNSIYTDRGFAIKIKDDEDWYGDRKEIVKAFKDGLNIELGKENLILKPDTYGNLISVFEQVLKENLKDQKRIPDERYDEIKEILGEAYAVNTRKPKDIFLKIVFGTYLFLKKAHEKKYPLYLILASEKDAEEYYGTYKFGDKLEEW